jgi:thioesterase domain-containing protein/acyl carrier protein
VFLGRVDEQLNVGGLRIEPAEIEALLTAIDGIHEAVVVEASIDGRPSLVAHVTGDERRVDRAVIRSALAVRIPAGAIPRVIVFHPDLPRTPHGKVDRTAAARLAGAGRRSPSTSAPSAVDDSWATRPEQPAPAEVADGRRGASTPAIVDVWRRALADPDLDEDADFFEMGGDSIAAVEVVTAVGELIGRPVAVATLLSAPTPRAMARAVGMGGVPAAARLPVSLVRLRRGVDGGPAVVLIAGWYDVQSYRALADALPSDVAVTALAVDEQPDGPPVLRTVDDLVEASTDVVRSWVDERAPAGLAIAGWSIGGVVAYELARRLRADGRQVDAVGLVDTYFPGEHRHVWANRWSTYTSLLRTGSPRSVLAQLGLTVRRRVRSSVAHVGRRLLTWAGETVERPAVITDAAGVPSTALDHVIGPPGDLTVVLYAASTTNPRRTELPWRSAVPALRTVVVEGRHRGDGSIMAAGRVHHIANDLAAIVRRGRSLSSTPHDAPG